MKNIKISTLFILMLLTSSGFGQSNKTVDLPSNTDRTPDSQSIRRETDSLLNDNSLSRNASEGTPETKLKVAKKLEADFLKDDITRLQAPAGYSTKYAAALNDKKTALARIYPDKNCFNSKTVSVGEAEKCADVPPLLGDGSYYSFRLKTNLNQKVSAASSILEKADRADIHYVNGKFSVGSDYIQGLIAEMGDVNLDSLTKDSAEIKSLKKYKAEYEMDKLKKQREAVKQGIALDGYTYSDSVPAKVGSTYILRSVAYRMIKPVERIDPALFLMVTKSFDMLDLRTDSIIAFKVVGQEKDGSLIILWKELSQKDAMVLKEALQ